MPVPIIGEAIGKVVNSVINKGADLISEFITDKDLAARMTHEFRTLRQTHDHEFRQLELEAEKEIEMEFSRRTSAMEGTASDLQHFGFLGKVVVFARGMFRPLFSYCVAYWDWVYFVSERTWTDQQQTLLLTVNLIVLVFYFGERAVKNLAPVLQKVFAK